MKIPDELIARFKAEGAQDWIGLWAIMWELRQLFPKATAEEIRNLTVDLVQQLLSAGFVVASVEDKAFVRWPDQTPASVARRILDEWKALGREPDIGDIAWFNLSPPSAS
jgi:hypothetical protein